MASKFYDGKRKGSSGFLSTCTCLLVHVLACVRVCLCMSTCLRMYHVLMSVLCVGVLPFVLCRTVQRQMHMVAGVK